MSEELTAAQMAQHLINRAVLEEIEAQRVASEARSKASVNSRISADWDRASLKDSGFTALNPYTPLQEHLDQRAEEQRQLAVHARRLREFVVEHFSQYVLASSISDCSE